MAIADVVLVFANVLYGTSYFASRVALDSIPPATLALVRLVLAAMLLGALAARSGRASPLARGDRWRIAWMGILGFSAAYALAHWGVYRSTVTNAALLIVVEPLTIILVSPVMLGERLRRHEVAGGALALVGSVLVVVNGVPGITTEVAPHWRGDVLLILSGVAFAAYTLIGRDVLARVEPMRVTVWSIVWGAVAVAPLAAAEWLAGSRPSMTTAGAVATLYLGLAISGVGYLVWNWAVQRVRAPRAAVSLTVQPIVGALLGTVLLGDPLTAFTMAGGLLIVLGLGCAVIRGARGRDVIEPSRTDGILDTCPSPAATSSRTTTRTD